MLRKHGELLCTSYFCDPGDIGSNLSSIISLKGSAYVEAIEELMTIHPYFCTTRRKRLESDGFLYAGILFSLSFYLNTSYLTYSATLVSHVESSDSSVPYITQSSPQVPSLMPTTRLTHPSPLPPLQ